MKITTEMCRQEIVRRIAADTNISFAHYSVAEQTDMLNPEKWKLIHKGKNIYNDNVLIFRWDNHSKNKNIDCVIESKINNTSDALYGFYEQ